jgi:hypothetical protein
MQWARERIRHEAGWRFELRWYGRHLIQVAVIGEGNNFLGHLNDSIN